MSYPPALKGSILGGLPQTPANGAKAPLRTPKSGGLFLTDTPSSGSGQALRLPAKGLRPSPVRHRPVKKGGKLFLRDTLRLPTGGPRPSVLPVSDQALWPIGRGSGSVDLGPVGPYLVEPPSNLCDDLRR